MSIVSYPIWYALTLCIFGLLAFWPNTQANGQGSTDFETKKLNAYHRFHRGEVLAASKDIRALADEAADIGTKTLLLRDLVEMCATAFDAQCAQEAEVEAFNNAAANEKLKFLIPELYSYLIAVQVWLSNNEFLEKFIEDGGAKKTFNPMANPVANANVNLAMHTYFVRKNDHKAAEDAYSSALLSLLLLDPKNKYGISKILVEMLEALIAEQDIVGARSLVLVSDAFLNANLNHEGPYFARYRLLFAQLLAFSNFHKAAAATLPEASRLNERLDIVEWTRSYRLASNNSLESLALLLDGQLAEALRVHSRHPMQKERVEILARGEFENYQEMYFALSDTILNSVEKQQSFTQWKPLFEKPFKRKQERFVEQNYESYRNFALALIHASEAKEDAKDLYRKSAWQRIDNFELNSRTRFEGFQLPSSVDLFIISAALTSVSKDPSNRDLDLLLKGSELLTRTLRQQLSDFAILIGSQKTESARNKARSYQLLAQQKRTWELQRIGDLLAERPINQGSVINTYTELVRYTSRLKESFSADPDYTEAAGYPDVAQIQRSLHPDEVFITYFPTFHGLGRLCIAKTTAISAVSPYSESVRSDIKLLQLALTADHIADAKLDSQFPVEAAVRMNDVLFSGLDKCMMPGVHINIALPEDMAGVPIGSLLTRTPKMIAADYDLGTADWIANSFSYSVTISARHFLGTKTAIARQQASLSYLGIGNPSLSEKTSVSTAAAPSELTTPSLPDLPETAQELMTVGRMLGANQNDILLGKAATEESFRSRALGSYDVIHFATHGLLKGEQKGILEPTLVLTPNDRSDSFDDGLLSASEISRFSLNSRLVVLSACNSARIDINSLSIGVNDLQSAFSIAGAPTLIASLWTIDSNSARDLMIQFFKAWQTQKEKSASKALSEAIRNFRKSADRAHQHPRFWAPFVVYGYGYALSPARKVNRSALSFEAVLNSSPGEVIDVKTIGDDLIYSSLGDWNGEKMASIVTRVSTNASGWRKRSFDVGAGKLVLAADSVFLLGYWSKPASSPVLVRYGLDGKLIWKKDFQEFSDLSFLAGTTVDGQLVILADSFSSSIAWRRTFLIKLNLDGTEIARTQLIADKANLLVGERAFLASANRMLATALVSQEEPKLDTSKSGILGIPPWCLGQVKTSVRFLGFDDLRMSAEMQIKDFQAHWIAFRNGELVLGGSSRDRCSSTTSAIVFSVTSDGKVRQVWSESDVFPSAVISMYEDGEDLRMLIRRERPLGVRTTVAAEVSGGSKRWGDKDNSLTEFSIVRISKTGRSEVEYNSSFGISSYPRGLLPKKGIPVVFGSLGGRPALSREWAQISKRQKRLRQL